jgi:hypothetical protein
MSDTLTAVPAKVKLAMSKKAQRKSNTRNSRPQFVGRMNDGDVRAKVYTSAKLSQLKLKVKDAETRNLDHGEQQLKWEDADNGVLVLAYIPLSERGNVKKFTLNF